MVIKLVRTLFLALGLVMIWLGFFYNHELNKQPVTQQKAEEDLFSQEREYDPRELEYYTLADDDYQESAEALDGVELDPLHITDFSIRALPADPVLEQSTEESTEQSSSRNLEVWQENEIEKDAEDDAEREPEEAALFPGSAGEAGFPLLLAGVGTFFIICGIFSCRVKP